MNIAFWLLVMIAMILLWFSLASRFTSVGSEFVQMINNAKSAMEVKEDESEDANEV